MSSSDMPVGPSDAMRLTRRAVCTLGAGLSVGVFAGFGGSRAVAAEVHDIRYVITDRRYAQSLEFGAILEGRGARRLEVSDGLTRLWREALVPLWEGKAGAVAGITQRGTWACLAEQARSAGLRSVLVGHHVFAAGDEPAAHVLSMPRPIPSIAAALERCGGAWPQVMADVAARYPAEARRIPDTCYRGAATAGSPSSLALTSWIIA